MELPSMHVSNGENVVRKRHPVATTSRLKEIFQTNPWPNHEQKLEICEELNLELKQVTDWFSYKRIRVKDAMEKELNDVLRAEYERNLEEKMRMKEAQRNVFCESCRHSLIAKQLRLENERLKENIENISRMLPRYLKKPEVSLELKLGPPTSSSDGDSLF